MTVVCAACAAVVGSPERVGRRDTCPACGADLHSCRQCRFHDVQAYNGCREPQAERVLDKERANFCDYFAPIARGVGAAASPAARSPAVAPPAAAHPAAKETRGGDPRAELERLFRRR